MGWPVVRDMIEVWFDKRNKTELNDDQIRRKMFTDTSRISEVGFCSLSTREFRTGDQTRFIDESHVLSNRLSDLCSEYLYEEGNVLEAQTIGRRRPRLRNDGSGQNEQCIEQDHFKRNQVQADLRRPKSESIML